MVALGLDRALNELSTHQILEMGPLGSEIRLRGVVLGQPKSSLAGGAHA